MPTLGFHVPEDSSLAKAVRARVSAEKHPSVSAYVRSVVERDVSGGGPSDAMSPTVLVDLTRRLLGELDAEAMAIVMSGRDQRRELQRALRAFLVPYPQPGDDSASRAAAHFTRRLHEEESRSSAQEVAQTVKKAAPSRDARK